MHVRMRAREHLTYCPAMAATTLAWRGWALVLAVGALANHTGAVAQEPIAEPAPAAEPTPASEQPAAVEAAAQIEASDARADAAVENSIDKDDRAPLAWHASLLW